MNTVTVCVGKQNNKKTHEWTGLLQMKRVYGGKVSKLKKETYFFYCRKLPSTLQVVVVGFSAGLVRKSQVLGTLREA